MHEVKERPRELAWYHAAGMLFGDWGTSRLYVLGLAFVSSGHASFWYVAAMGLIMTLVGFCYTIVCKHFPNGGGVYSSAKQRSRTIACVGAFLLLADYVVTAALSTYDGFRYLLPHNWDGLPVFLCSFGLLAALGALNYFGLRRVGAVAAWVAGICGVLYAILAAYCVYHTWGHPAVIHPPEGSFGDQWKNLVHVILALSGVEAIANMTGVMSEPVAKNARKAIFTVLLEVVALNLIMAYAMNALPLTLLDDPGASVPAGMLGYTRDDAQDHMLKILATHLVGPLFATVSSCFFALLLFSAANTAMGDIVSVQYLMARDKELPAPLTKLNRYGMPWLALVVAVALPMLMLVITLILGKGMEFMADLYAIGVVGAISINLLTLGSNPEVEMKRWERALLLSVGTLTAGIEVTIMIDKPWALVFALAVLTVGLSARFLVQRHLAAKAKMETVPVASIFRPPSRKTVALAKHRFLVPSRGNPRLLKFAAHYAKLEGATLFVLFVREVVLTIRERGVPVATEDMTLDNDLEAQKVFDEAQKICLQADVQMLPLYSVSDSTAEMICDHAATLGVDSVLMGVSKRGALYKAFRGDVLREVTHYLPESIQLLVHA